MNIYYKKMKSILMGVALLFCFSSCDPYMLIHGGDMGSNCENLTSQFPYSTLIGKREINKNNVYLFVKKKEYFSERKPDSDKKEVIEYFEASDCLNGYIEIVDNIDELEEEILYDSFLLPIGYPINVKTFYDYERFGSKYFRKKYKRVVLEVRHPENKNKLKVYYNFQDDSVKDGVILGLPF